MRRKRAVKRSVKPASSQLVDAILALVNVKYGKFGAFARRVNVHGPARSISGFGGVSRCGERGEADIDVTFPVHLPNGGPCQQHMIKVEAKYGSGRQSPEQKVFELQYRASGFHYLVARSQDDLEDYLRDKGIIPVRKA